MEVEVRAMNDKIIVKTPFDKAFIEKLKDAFTESERTYNERNRTWEINYSEENLALVQKLVDEHFNGVKDKLVVFKCMGKAPRVNNMLLIEYHRDYDKKLRAWCFDVIGYKRMGDHGSRKYPKFEGIVLARVKMNRNTTISSKGDMEYRDFPYSKVLHMTALELLKTAESLDDFEKICQTLDKQSQKLSNTLKVEKQAVVVKGFLVLSTLPSKALLDVAFPEEFKNTRIGTKLVKVVSGYFYNKLGSLSRKFYKYILEKHAVWAGFGYIVPAHKVREFIRDVEELRKEYENFEVQLREFLEHGKIPEGVSERAKIDPEYVELVKEYLREKGIVNVRVPEITERVKIRLVPFSIDMKMVEEYLEDKAVKSVQKELEAVKQEMFENLRNELEEKMNVIFEKLKNYEKIRMSKTALRKLKEDINNVINTAEDLGVEIERLNILRKTVETIEEIEALEKGKKEKVKVETEADGRIKALLEEIGISG